MKTNSIYDEVDYGKLTDDMTFMVEERSKNGIEESELRIGCEVTILEHNLKSTKVRYEDEVIGWVPTSTIVEIIEKKT